MKTFKTNFWNKFGDLMSSLPEYIDEQINVIGTDNTINQKSSFGSSTSVISQGGNKIEVCTKNGKTTIKVNGKEYVEKK